MPLPLAHSIAGATIYKGLDADGGWRAWPRLFVAVLIANAADFDLIPGILTGEPNRYHHVGFSHSLVFACAAAVLVALIASARGWSWPTISSVPPGWISTTLVIGLLLASHVLLDALNRDYRPPPGVPMLWPLSAAYVQIYPWFVEVEKLGGEGTPLAFVASVLNAHNLYAMLWELVTLAPLLALAAWWRARRAVAG